MKLINISTPSFCVMTAPEIYSLSQFPGLNTILLSVAVTLPRRSLDRFTLHNCNLVPFDQLLPSSPTFPLQPVLPTSVFKLMSQHCVRAWQKHKVTWCLYPKICHKARRRKLKIKTTLRGHSLFISVAYEFPIAVIGFLILRSPEYLPYYPL